ncbi:hypothetical protein JTB14_025950 [Gonioctena quinquepunctata]|nr:hypothetical protein JTB14_025950 [Gonioctena quinquepunctata]
MAVQVFFTDTVIWKCLGTSLHFLLLFIVPGYRFDVGYFFSMFSQFFASWVICHLIQPSSAVLDLAASGKLMVGDDRKVVSLKKAGVSYPHTIARHSFSVTK